MLVPFRKIDLEAMKYICSRAVDGSPLKIQAMQKKLDKAWRKGQLWKGEDKPDQKWRMCEGRMMLGDFSDWEGWQYRDHWAAGLWHNPKCFDIPPWDGVSRGTLYVFGEQGIGDEIFFSQLIPQAQEYCHVVYECEPRLRGIFERMGCEVVESNISEDKRGRWQQKPRGDYWLPAGDQARVFWQKPPFFHPPQVTVLPDQVERFKRYKGRVGVSWRGAQGEYEWRQFDFLDPVCLQYDPDWDCDLEMPDLDLKQDIEGILGLLANLSHVYTVSTTVAHLACGLGVPTTVILAPPNGKNSNRLPWKWGINRQNPFYKWCQVYQGMSEFRLDNQKLLKKCQ